MKVTVADVGAALPMYRVLDCIRDEHDYRLVLLAVAICAVTSWTAWYLYAMSATARGLSRLAWILQTAVAAGSGIWATHFIAMLAFDDMALVYAAKRGIIVGSLLAGLAGALMLRAGRLLRDVD